MKNLPLKNNRSTIPTHKRLEYDRGYLGRGLVNEAAIELEKIEVGGQGIDRGSGGLGGTVRGCETMGIGSKNCPAALRNFAG